MAQPTVKQIKDFLAPMADENIILSLGIAKDGSFKITTCAPDTPDWQKQQVLAKCK